MAWSVLQSASDTNSAAPFAATFTTANLSSGTKLIAAIAGGANSPQSISSVKDGTGNSMTALASFTLTDGNSIVALYAMDTPAGDVGTKPTITVTFGIAGSASILVQEVSGLAAGNTTAMIDGTAGTAAVTGSSGSTTSPSYSSTAANEYLVVVYGDLGNGITWTAPSSPWTGDANGVNTSFNADIEIAYRNSTGGSETGQYSINGGVDYGIILVAFKLAGGVAGPPLYDAPVR